MMYNDVGNDLQPFEPDSDVEEYLFSDPKTSSTGASFLQEDDDEHLRHQHNVVAGTSSAHLPDDVEDLLLTSNFGLEATNCDQSLADQFSWNCKEISEDQLNEFLPQSHISLSGNSVNCNGTSNYFLDGQHTGSASILAIDQHLNHQNHDHQQQQQQQHSQHQPQQPQIQQHLSHHHHQQHQQSTGLIQQHQQPSQTVQTSQLRHGPTISTHHEPYQITIISSGPSSSHQQHLVSNGGPLLNTLTSMPSQYCHNVQTVVSVASEQSQQSTTATLDQAQILIARDGINGGVVPVTTAPVGSIVIGPYSNHSVQHPAVTTLISNNNSTSGIINPQQLQQHQLQQQQDQPQTAQAQPRHVVLSQAQHVPITTQTQQVQASTQSVPSSFQGQVLVKIEQPSENQDTSKKEVAVKANKPKEKQTRLDCPYCKRSFSKNFDLQQHMRCHTGEKPFQCIVCGRGFAQKSNVKKHMQAHKVWPEGPNNSPMPSNHSGARSRNNSASSSMGTPRDDECMQENESLQINDNNNVNSNGNTLGLSNDRRNEGNDIFTENRYSCSYCQFNGKTYFELKSHLTIHKREKVFKCIVSSCGKTFSGSDLQGFLDHVTGHKDLIYNCHLCSGQFYSLDEFGEHQKNHSNAQIKRTGQPQALSSNQQQASANVTNRQSNTSLRQQNQQVTPTQLQPQQNQRQYNQQIATQTTHQQQQNNQRNPRPLNSARPNSNQKYFRCGKCMNRYTTQSALDHHMTISTHNFPCSECNKVFMCERYLRRHLNTHTAVQHVCTFCDKHFKTAAYLKMHSVVHTGEKPFRCNQCEAAFNRRDKLNRHKLTHEAIKKYKCPFRPHIGCTKEFNRPDKLKAHVLTHSGIRPHPCDACSRTFSRLSRLREHKKLHHDNSNNVNLKPTSVPPSELENNTKQTNVLLVTDIDSGNNNDAGPSETKPQVSQICV